MQRKALKQLNKVTQWTNEKVFLSEKTQFSSDFTDFEREVEPKRIGIERLHATSEPFFDQLTKIKPTADPYAPGGGKDKILATEALGLVMIDYGSEVGGAYGDGLSKYGRARCKLAVEEFGSRLREGYIAGMEEALVVVNDYKALRKKLDSRRLTLDANITRLKSSKRENTALEQEVEVAQQRFEEAEEETQARMEVIQQREEQQFAALADLLDAELDYFTKCKDILEDLRTSFPSYSGSSTRPRAKSNASARSAKMPTRSYSRPSLVNSDDDAPAGRSRSASNASAGRGKDKDRDGKEERRSMFSSFGSFGKKAGQTNLRDVPKSFKKEGKYGNLSDDERRAALTYETEDTEDDDQPAPALVRPTAGNRARSQSSVAKLGGTDGAPPMRRSVTTPSFAARHVKALYDFVGSASDELSFASGDVIQVTSEVSNEWYIGELHGRSGLFPRAYTEEHAPTPTTATPPNLPRRTLPPPASNGARRLPPPTANRAPSLIESTDGDGDADSYAAFSDDDVRQSVSLATSAQPAPMTSNRARASSIKKPAPPPPPSRRSASSNNLAGSAGYLVPPPAPGYQRSRSSTLSRHVSVEPDSSPDPGAGVSPFAGSEDEESAAEDTRPAPGVGGMSSGLGQLHLGAGAGSRVGQCAACGCDDFTQNVFKAKGVCSTCFHQH